VTRGQIKKIIVAENIIFIHLQFSDLNGCLKDVVIDVKRLEDVLENGLWFDGSSVEGFARIAESDMLLRPDTNTFAILPWSSKRRKAARFICDIYRPSGRRLAADPRFILQKVLRQARQAGIIYKTGAEFEFYLLERESMPRLIPHDYKSYFDYTPHSRASEICELTTKALRHFGIRGEIYHHEVGQGQHEIDIRYDEALKTADNILTLKMILKAYTGESELKATWMPKPIFGFPGNGLHIHQSLWQGKKNIFYRSQNSHFLSLKARQFLAGQLSHANALIALAAPTVNSYKRLVGGFEAPVYVCWGKTNRSALIRVPNNSLSKVAMGTRLEYRASDPSCNLYLALAGLLKAGLDGINKKLVPPRPVEEDVFHFTNKELTKNSISLLPRNLREAVSALKKDSIVNSVLGNAKTRFYDIKEREWEDFSSQVTSWEIKHSL